MVKATDVLKAEHQVIMRVLDCLESAVQSAEQNGELDIDTIEKSVDFFRGFADISHHGKEDVRFFPLLAERNVSCPPGTPRILLGEHEEGRDTVKGIADQLEEYKNGDREALRRICLLSRRYIEHLSRHIQKEDNCLFPKADERLSEEEQRALSRAFEEAEQRELAGLNEKYVQIAEQLCDKWHIKRPPHLR